jgi:hypothetical protein
MTPETVTLSYRYAGAPPGSLTCSVLSEWMNDLTPVMSTSSGPKAYTRNVVWAYFQAHPNAQRVRLMRANGPMFAIHEDAEGRWFDCTGRELKVKLAGAS